MTGLATLEAKMRIFLTFIALSLLLGVARGATDCTVEPLATVDGPNGALYLYSEDCQFNSCLFSVWVIEETNGQPGLQRYGDEFEPATCKP